MTRGVCIQEGGWADPPDADTHLTDAWDNTGYSQQAGGMHSTGMCSCYYRSLGIDLSLDILTLAVLRF